MQRVRESLLEFQKGIDPKDAMRTGAFYKDFTHYNKVTEWLADNLELVLKKIPDDILNDETHTGDSRFYIHPNYHFVIKDFVENHFTVKNEPANFNPMKLHELLKDKYPHLKSWMFPDPQKNIFEFERGQDPRTAMNTGVASRMIKDLENLGYTPDQYEILPDLTIKMKKMSYGMTDTIKRIELKHKEPKQFEFIEKIRREERRSTRVVNVKEAVDKAIKDGISPETIRTLLKDWAEKQIAHEGIIYLNKQIRTKDEEQYDNEYNIYAFIGFQEKVPVKGTKYFEDKLGTESIIKVDKFNTAHLHAISMMKLRARVQYSGEGQVYIVHVPPELMDEDRYESIPKHMYDIFVKYKQKV